MAPVPRLQIMIGRTLGGATVAVIQGLLVTLVCVMAGFRPVSFAHRAARHGLHGAHRARLCSSWRRNRLRLAGHAGLSAHHELPRHAHLLPVRCLVPARRTAEGAGGWSRQADPLSYGIDGMRSVLLGRTRISAPLSI